MPSPTLRVLMLPRYDALGASSRLRMLQYVPGLERMGIRIDAHPLLGFGYVSDLYDGRVSIFKVACAYARRFRVVLFAKRYDVIWLEKELFPWLPAWLEAAILPKDVPLVTDFDDAVFHRYDEHRSQLVRSFLGRKIDRVMRRSRLVTVGNDYLADRARRAGASNVEWLPTVVDMERYGLRGKDDQSRDVVIGWIGSPATAHYLHSLTDVLSEIAARHSVRCVAIGARSDQLTGTPFEYWAWSESREVELLRQIDIGIMPLPDAPWERGKCGFKLIQYMACGLPVVASPVGVNKEIVLSSGSGSLATTREEWIQAIDRLVLSANLRQRLGAAGRAKVEETYSVQAQIGRLSSFLLRFRPTAVH